MSLRKQDFYEGAALYLLARTGQLTNVKYVQPFFILNECKSILLKYSTKGRSPWGFTFTPDEQILLQKTSIQYDAIIGLICGHDGVAALSYPSYRTIASLRESSIHIACRRKHDKHYEISGPDGVLDRKVAPSYWKRILVS